MTDAMPSAPCDSPKEGNDVTKHFSCDLVSMSFKHSYFLRTLHELGVSHQKLGNESLRRYSELWLPLVKGSPQEELFPPPDIAWLWHCHRLAPKDFERYTNEEFGVLLEANPPFAVHTNEDATGKTSVLWNKLYPSDPFFLPCDQKGGSDHDKDKKLLSGFDLLASTERQATFLWQVSGERFDDIDFLNEGVENYCKFLSLKPKAQAKRMTLVPTYQIDLMWHTHILSSIALYNKDCEAITGSPFHHDDSLTDRTEGSVLDTSFRDTTSLWLEEYGIDYFVSGGMYRGEPPPVYFSKRWTAYDSTAVYTQAPREMGASSTSPASGPTKWASVTGVASDGQLAFIPTNTHLRRDLVSYPIRDNYVLGKRGGKVGYFHLETREAQCIICDRIRAKNRKLAHEIAFDRSCCGNPNSIALNEARLRKAEEALRVMEARRDASKPAGVELGRGAANRNELRNDYYDHGGVWLYPIIIWNSCGGACGGTVAYCHGGSACGGGAW